MKSSKVTIVDYGVGNLYSVQRAFEVCGASDICVSNNPAEIMSAERVVLPGVGAFADGMRGLRERGLDHAIRDFAKSGRPVLGICLGMQLFATYGEEFGECQGLDLIPGKVQEMPKQTASGELLRLPFIGWSPITNPHATGWEDSVLRNCGEQDFIYLVHSFQFKPTDCTDLLAVYRRYGVPITAAIRRRNITGLQFHPEKSGKVGLNLLRNFLALP